jgi:hypothetical protein
MGEIMRGGKREGAGRKKLPVSEKRNAVTIRLPQYLIDELDKLHGSRTELIERALVNTQWFEGG